MITNEELKIHYDEVDKELVNIIKLINKYEGIQTTECCVGHEKHQPLIYFKVNDIRKLNNFMHKVFENTDWMNGWNVRIVCDDIRFNSDTLHLCLTVNAVVKEDVEKWLYKLESYLIEGLNE